MDKYGLSDRTINEILSYFRQNPFVDIVKIFGSRVKSTFRVGSDIDFAIWLSEKGKISVIANDLDNLLTPYKFDVIEYNNLSDENMKKSIDNDGIVFYQKEVQSY